MKSIILLSSLILGTQAMAETFKLPAGTTFRAQGVGYDCGEFTTDYLPAPTMYAQRNVEFVQLSADKHLNTFLVEANYEGAEGQKCIYGGFYDRDRSSVRINLSSSEVVTDGAMENCLEGQAWLDEKLGSLKYEASKRGYRFVALHVIEDEQNELCETNTVRTVFDRR